ncbi:hypothetical protein MKX03_008792 [Papaver bracteatum]|nr:hypothetical protein MKX03_008792 [Papaver bracteatum]
MSGRGPGNENTKYYQVLGIPKDASPEQVKMAYTVAAIKNHPYEGGDPEKFNEVAQAYAVLSAPEIGEIYDQYAEEEALKEGTCRGGPRAKMRGEDVV